MHWFRNLDQRLRFPSHGFALLLFLLVISSLFAFSWQSMPVRANNSEPVQVKDFNFDQISNLIDVDGVLFFVVYLQLWKSDGTEAGTLLVKEFMRGSLNNLTSVNGTLFFVFDDTSSGEELWRSDGTTEGTILVKDISPGATSSEPQMLINVDGRLFFRADDGIHGVELWQSDGTEDGTTLVMDINPGSASSYPDGFVSFNGALFFHTHTHGGIWRSNGTVASTAVVFSDDKFHISSYLNLNSAVMNNTLFFSGRDGLWRSDGTTQGTTFVGQVFVGSIAIPVRPLISTNDKLYLRESWYNKLWVSDGTIEGTVFLKDIWPGSTYSAPGSPSDFVNVNGTLFFTSDDGVHGREVWKSDGTTSGTRLVKDINEDILYSGHSSNPSWLTAIGDTLFFVANDGINGSELWKSDSSGTNTTMVTDIIPTRTGSSSPQNLVSVNGILFFTIANPVSYQQTELWKYTPPIEESPTPTPILTPTPTSTPIPTPSACMNKPLQSRQVGGLTIYADSFAETGEFWTANGTIWLGDYTVLTGATLSSRGATLSGNGQINLSITENGKNECKALMSGRFEINNVVGEGDLLRPLDLEYAWQLNSIVGFRIEEQPVQVRLNLTKGELEALAAIAIAIPGPGNSVIQSVGISLDATGQVNGILRNITYALGEVSLQIKRATLGNSGFTVNDADLILPSRLGGTRAKLSVTDARITADGNFTLINSEAVINFPNIRIGKNKGFEIDGAQVSVAYREETFFFGGKGTFGLPGVGKGDKTCRLGTDFTLASRPPPFRSVKLSISGCLKVPIGMTKFSLTSVSGEVNIDTETIAVDLSVGIDSDFEIVDKPVISANPLSAHWDDSWKVGLEGELKLFSFDVAESALELSQAQGLKGTVHISLVGMLEANGTIRVWHDQSGFHITGRADAQLQIDRGEIFEGCAIGLCVEIPPEPVNEITGIDLGEFRRGNTTIYGLKGYIDLFGYQGAFLIDSEGDLTFDGVTEYALTTPSDPPQRAELQATAQVRQLIVPPGTQALIIGLAFNTGTPVLSLSTPSNQELSESSPSIVTTRSVGQTLLTVSNPQQGQWQVSVNNLLGDEQFHIVALGADLVPTISPPVITRRDDGSIDIGLAATSGTITSTINLFYDTSTSNHTGKPIVQDLPISTSTYSWQPEAVISGTYHIYAMIDDPLGGAIYAYATDPITINDNTSPEPPTQVRATIGTNSAVISWQLSPTSDVAGYRVAFQEPETGTIFVSDVPNGRQASYEQLGLYLDGRWQVRVSAYDINGNESPQSRAVSIIIGQTNNNIFLPLISFKE